MEKAMHRMGENICSENMEKGTPEYVVAVSVNWYGFYENSREIPQKVTLDDPAMLLRIKIRIPNDTCTSCSL